MTPRDPPPGAPRFFQKSELFAFEQKSQLPACWYWYYYSLSSYHFEPVKRPMNNRLGSAGGKTTVSHAQVSLVEASKGVPIPLRPNGLVPPCIPGQGSAIPREGRRESCFRGGLLKGCAARVCTVPPPLSPFCRPPPPTSLTSQLGS